jgi:hypothetical protein
LVLLSHCWKEALALAKAATRIAPTPFQEAKGLPLMPLEITSCGAFKKYGLGERERHRFCPEHLRRVDDTETMRASIAAYTASIP